MSWDNKEHVYVASADRWNGLEYFFNNHKVMQCSTFYTVIGGLGGLNFLRHLKLLKKIVFYDVNRYTALILDLYLELIKNSDSINDFITSIYLRPFEMEKDKDYTAFYNKKINLDLIPKYLSDKNKDTFNHYFLPYVREPLRALLGPTKHCSRILLDDPTTCLTDPMVFSIFEYNLQNKNSLFLTHGWLENNETFIKTKETLKKCEIEVLIEDIELTGPEPGSGIYFSNIYDFSPDFSQWKKFIHKYLWAIGYDSGKCQYYPQKSEGLIEYHELLGEGLGPHDSCCYALNQTIDLNANSFLEVIEPHQTDGMNYGFRFYKGQKKISVEDYLKTSFKENIISLHILLGGGVTLDTWYKVLLKVHQEADIIILFEHRKECKDWPEWDVYSDNLLYHKKLDEYIFSIDHRWKKIGCPSLKGDISDVRNIFYFLKKV